jgi:hypothetical protein
MPAAEAAGSLETLVRMAAAVVVAVVLVAVLPFVSVRYRYRFEDGLLVIGRAVLGVIPCGEHRVRLSDIAAVQRCGRGGGRHCLNYGATLSANGVLLILRRRSMMYGSIRVTPGDAEGFMQEVRARIGGQGQTEESRSRSCSARAPRATQDPPGIEGSKRPGGNGRKPGIGNPP